MIALAFGWGWLGLCCGIHWLVVVVGLSCWRVLLFGCRWECFTGVWGAVVF